MGGLDLLDLRCRIPGRILRQNLPLIIPPSVPIFCNGWKRELILELEIYFSFLMDKLQLYHGIALVDI